MTPVTLRSAVSWAAIGLLVAAAIGCGQAQTASNAESRVQEPAAPAAAPIDLAIERSAAFLEQRQSADGAWRSDVYAPFRAGDALTPIVLLALQSLPPEQQPKPSIERGLVYLQSFVGEDGTVHPPRSGIAYPVYLAAGALLALSDRGDETSNKSRLAWLEYLRARQLTEENGWQPDDIYYGGWSYAPDLPRKPAAGSPLNPLVEPNISATAFALDALRAAGMTADAPEFAKARQFVERCQNFPAAGAEPTEFDDGGFFFLQSDAVRNKAGTAGRDAQQRERFASYGSTTSDGLHALLAAGADPHSPRVRSAVDWLRQHFSPVHQPGNFEVEAARNSVYFYYARSVALLLEAHRKELEAGSIDVREWSTELAAELLKRQRADGSWVNADVEVREDDPLVATSLATAALAACQRVLDDSPSGSVIAP